MYIETNSLQRDNSAKTFKNGEHIRLVTLTPEEFIEHARDTLAVAMDEDLESIIKCINKKYEKDEEKPNIIADLANMIDTLYAISNNLGVSNDTIDAERKLLFKKFGGFDKRILMRSMYINTSNDGGDT